LASVNLPSVQQAKDLTEVKNVVEKLRKELDYVLSNLDSDNFNQQYAMVIETGSTANGNYRKYSDGTMECWLTWTGITNTIPWSTQAAGASTYYYSNGTWVFPKAFKTGSIVTVMASGRIAVDYPQTFLAWHNNETKCNTHVGVFGIDIRSGTGTAYQSWFARGQWK
jgi:hypothetical protein